MKVRVKITAATVALCAAIAGTASFAAPVQYNPGDLVIGFRVTSEASDANRNLLVNIGSAAAYNNGNMPFSLTNPVTNIGAQLSSAYGAAWSGRTDLAWGAVGMRQNVPNWGSTDPVIDGDSRGVVYVSRASTGIGESNPWETLDRNPVSFMSTRVSSLLHGSSGGFSEQESYDGNAYAVLTTSGDNVWSNHIPSYSFGILSGTIESSVKLVTESLIFLDLYRITPENGVASTWVMTLALDSSGNVYAVPEPSTYAAIIGVAGLGLVIARRVRRNKVAA